MSLVREKMPKVDFGIKKISRGACAGNARSRSRASAPTTCMRRRKIEGMPAGAGARHVLLVRQGDVHRSRCRAAVFLPGMPRLGRLWPVIEPLLHTGKRREKGVSRDPHLLSSGRLPISPSRNDRLEHYHHGVDFSKNESCGVHEIIISSTFNHLWQV